VYDDLHTRFLDLQKAIKILKQEIDGKKLTDQEELTAWTTVASKTQEASSLEAQLNAIQLARDLSKEKMQQEADKIEKLTGEI